MQENGKTPNDVNYILFDNGYTDWENFAAVSDVEYDNGFGGEEVKANLCVVGSDWWLERWEYDGSEGWDYREPPTREGKERTHMITPLYGR